MNQSDMWAKLKIFAMEHAKTVMSVDGLNNQWNMVIGATYFFCRLTNRDEEEALASTRNVEQWFVAGLPEQWKPLAEEWFRRTNLIRDKRVQIDNLVDNLARAFLEGGPHYASRN